MINSQQKKCQNRKLHNFPGTLLANNRLDEKYSALKLTMDTKTRNIVDSTEFTLDG